MNFVLKGYDALSLIFHKNFANDISSLCLKCFITFYVSITFCGDAYEILLLYYIFPFLGVTALDTKENSRRFDRTVIQSQVEFKNN